MNVHLRTGTSRTFRLKHAILLYEDGATTFATLHGVTATADAAPQLTAGRAVSTAFLHTLAAGLRREVRTEILPANVLVRSAEAIAWWTRGCRRPMFFRGTDPKAECLNGKVYPHPALVFLISGKDLFVRALGEDTRPSADTRLQNAPYWNTDARGLVCQGDMRVPDEVAVSTIRGWEEHFSGAHLRIRTAPSG